MLPNAGPLRQRFDEVGRRIAVEGRERHILDAERYSGWRILQRPGHEAYQSCGLEPYDVHEVSGLQTALGLVAAGEGVCIVPEAVQRLRRDDVMYRRLDEELAVSPIIMFCRLHDSSREIVMLLDLIRELYAKKNGCDRARS